MKKQILILMLAILLIGNVLALDKSLGLSPTQITALESKGIKNIEIIDYPCQAGIKCYAFDGDVKGKLIEIQIKVKDNCIQSTRQIPITKVSKGKSYQMMITERTCTGVYNYRDITQEEIDEQISKASNNILTNIIKVDEEVYYPIKEGTDVQSKPIEIGKSVGDWIAKKIKQIGDVLGL